MFLFTGLTEKRRRSHDETPAGGDECEVRREHLVAGTVVSTSVEVSLTSLLIDTVNIVVVEGESGAIASDTTQVACIPIKKKRRTGCSSPRELIQSLQKFENGPIEGENEQKVVKLMEQYGFYQSMDLDEAESSPSSVLSTDEEDEEEVVNNLLQESDHSIADSPTGSEGLEVSAVADEANSSRLELPVRFKHS